MLLLYTEYYYYIHRILSPVLFLIKNDKKLLSVDWYLFISKTNEKK